MIASPYLLKWAIDNLKTLKKNKANDHDLAASETLIDFYAKRPVRKADDSLIDFVANYQITKGKNNDDFNLYFTIF